MAYAQKYLERAIELIQTIESVEMEKIQKVAAVAAQSIMDGGILHLFGSGHSAIPTQEVYIRAGSLSNTRPISLERFLDSFERIEGVGKALMRGFDGKKGEVLIVFSNSGVNPLPIEVAQIGKQLGLFTVCVCSFEHTAKAEPRLADHTRLCDVVDIAIDSHTPYGDAGLEMPGLPMHIGPLSTIAGVSIVNAIVAETVEQLVAAGVTPPVRISRNTPGGDAHNLQFQEKYADRIPELKL
jgi:uncharacterized phosphosugar-binding protein